MAEHVQRPLPLGPRLVLPAEPERPGAFRDLHLTKDRFDDRGAPGVVGLGLQSAQVAGHRCLVGRLFRIHLRTTNAIESTFATVRLRQRVTKSLGC